MYRNQNRNKTLADYDLNIFIPEEWDEEAGESYYDPTQWFIHVYIVDGNGHHEMEAPFELNSEDIRKLGLNRDEYFEYHDAWYGMDGFKKDYWPKMTDRVKQYLESFPKYVEDLG